MEKVVNRMINDAVEGVDTYKTDGSTWLIFTETKKWVIELTKDGTLWYNYNFFKDLLIYLSMDVVENQHYITKWVEDNVINKVKRTSDLEFRNQLNVEDTIQNGVKATFYHAIDSGQAVKDTIQNGVMHTMDIEFRNKFIVEDTIQNGVKDTLFGVDPDEGRVEDTIENGVKETKLTTSPFTNYVEDAIENGVKETKTPGEDGDILGVLDFLSDNNTNSVTRLIDDVIDNGVKYTGGIGNPNWMGNKVEKAIENGVKHTEAGGYLGSIEMKGKIVHQLESPKQNNEVEDVIQHGVKETCCHDMKLTKSVEKIIQKGIKNTYSDILPKEYDWSNQFDVQEVIDNGVKHTEYGDWEDGDERLDDIIQNGVKATLNDPHHRQREVVQTMKEGIKETIGEDYPHTNRIDGVIKNGVKETLSSIYPIERVVEKVVEVGVLETKSMDEWVNTDYIVNKVMDNGIKEVQPLPAQDGNRDWGNYYYRKEDITKPHTKYVDDVLEKGEKI
jgi:predicted peroxiredoxin